MHPKPHQPQATEHFAFLGQVGHASFGPWITRHAAKLGLTGQILGQKAHRLDGIFSGPPELLEALALASSLGPCDVWVDEVDRVPANALSRDVLSSRTT